ncbi:MAG TPA: hypothetical protein VHS07_07260, partial [Candidatus Binataceae bacterium]|nr:hypothetical protein [Candidatus Binataceae bacterium]
HGTGLPTLALFFGLAGGIEAYGPIGIFAGPAVISIFAALLRVYERTYTRNLVRNPAISEESMVSAPGTIQSGDPVGLEESAVRTLEASPQPQLKEDLP